MSSSIQFAQKKGEEEVTAGTVFFVGCLLSAATRVVFQNLRRDPLLKVQPRPKRYKRTL